MGKHTITISDRKPSNVPPAGNIYLLGFFLLAGLAHALFYVFFIPPWFHHDEPSHLEYVLLVSQLGRVPEIDERQQEIASLIGRSMIETGFSDKMGGIPDLNPPPGKITQIGFSQLGGPPLYYFLAAIPVGFYTGSDILVQLHLARIVSAMFYLLNICAAWGLARELFTVSGPHHSPLGGIHFMHIALPAFLVLMPAHVDIMTAVNTDAPAIAFSGLTLWGTARLLRIAYAEDRIAWKTVAGTVLSAGLAVAFKETAVVILPAAGLALLFAFLRCLNLGAGKIATQFIQQWLAWLVILVGGVVVLFFILRFDEAASWIRLTDQEDPIRYESPVAPDGAYVGMLALPAQRFPAWHVNLYQSLAHKRLPAAYPANFTFGVWMWADTPLETDLPAFSIGPNTFTRRVNLTTKPQFYTHTFMLQAYSAPTVRISLHPSQPMEDSNRIFVDGMVLAEGVYSLTEPPVFHDGEFESGLWGGQPFQNIIRNGSFEQPGLRLAPWLDRRLAPYIPDQSLPSSWLQAMSDWAGLDYYYYSTTLHLFRTFWARFAWGNLALVPDFPLIGAYPYRKIAYLCLALVGLTVIALVSRGLLRQRPYSQAHPGNLPYAAAIVIIFIFSLTLVLAWGTTLLRGALYTGVAKIFYPVARYALPAVLPSLLGLLAGWGILTESLQIRIPGARWISIIIFLLAMLFLDALSLTSIVTYLSR